MADIETVKKSLIRKPSGTDSVLDYGKLPPQAKEVEEAVLGAILIEEAAIHDVVEIIKTPEVFYVDTHQRIWRAVKALYTVHSKIDLLTVVEQLKKHGELDAAGGVYSIAQLTNKIGSAANIEYHARIIVEMYVKRVLITSCTEVIKSAYEDTSDAFELVDHALSLIEVISTDFTGQAERIYGDLFLDEVDKLRTANAKGDHITGLETFSAALDKHLLGFQPGNLIVIAGRPGMGKTSVAWHLALAQARNHQPVGFFSLEQKDRELIHKHIAAEITVDSKEVRKGDLSIEQWGRLDKALPRITGYPIHLIDKAGLTITQMLAIARNWVRKHGVKCIYIDYIGKIRTGGEKKFGTREQEVSHISGALKDFANNMNIPVVVLAQLSREVEKRGGDKRAILSDLRESGSIEQDADLVIFPYRPEYYGFDTDENGERYQRGYCELDIAKYRQGEPGIVRWIFEAKYSRYYDYGDFNQPGQTAGGEYQPQFRPLTNEEKSGSDDLPI